MNRMWLARLTIFGGLLVATVGCNPFTLAYFLSGGPRDVSPPDLLALTPVKPKKEATVLVLTSAQIGLAPDLAPIERMLSTELILAMKGYAVESKEKLVFIKQDKIDAFKSDNPNWYLRKRGEIGKEFEADYVIDIQVGNLRLNKPGSKELLQGRADVSVSAYVIAKPEDPPLTAEKTVIYPRTFEKHLSDTPRERFAKEFVRSMANELSFYFVSHPFDQTIGRVDKPD